MNAKTAVVTSLLMMTAVLQACSLKPQYLRLDPPPLKVEEVQVGNGTTVGLQVADVRSSRKLGEVGDPDNKMVDVNLADDPSTRIYERVKGALTKMGFTVVPGSENADPVLNVELRKLELQSVKTPFTFETELRAEVAAHASKGSSYYDRQFNVRTRKDGAAPPFEKDSNRLVNTAVSQALEDLLSDQQLLDTLAR